MLKARLKKWVFKSCLNVSELETSQTWVGSAFYADGPVYENACSLNLVFSWGSRLADVDKDCRSERDCLALLATVKKQSLIVYAFVTIITINICHVLTGRPDEDWFTRVVDFQNWTAVWSIATGQHYDAQLSRFVPSVIFSNIIITRHCSSVDDPGGFMW